MMNKERVYGQGWETGKIYAINVKKRIDVKPSLDRQVHSLDVFQSANAKLAKMLILHCRNSGSLEKDKFKQKIIRFTLNPGTLQDIIFPKSLFCLCFCC
jgi:hypothetical protein